MSEILNIDIRCYPQQYGYENEPVKITVVLVAGEIEDYAVYIGRGTPEWVAQFGNKLSFREACCHFMGLKEEKYRI